PWKPPTSMMATLTPAPCRGGVALCHVSTLVKGTASDVIVPAVGRDCCPSWTSATLGASPRPSSAGSGTSAPPLPGAAAGPVPPRAATAYWTAAASLPSTRTCTRPSASGEGDGPTCTPAAGCVAPLDCTSPDSRGWAATIGDSDVGETTCLSSPGTLLESGD